ncbi:hypothetical protein DMUE_2480 [Dictyocoela muelleri]|nr:hypothetical protein DMUE_2480 [Dictyocoela muelleri]
MNINSYVEIHIGFDKIKNAKFNFKFYCLLSLPYDIVLGSYFFIKNNVIIDYIQLFVKIENCVIEICPEHQSHMMRENELIKNVLFNSKDINTNFNFIREYRINIPINRTIKGKKCKVFIFEKNISL